MDLPVIKLFPDEHLNEIYQNTGYLFAFVNEKMEMCHTFVKCRDFLQDAAKCSLTDGSCSIFGFRYNKRNPKIDFNTMRMVVTKDNYCIGDTEAFHGKMLLALKMLNILEKQARKKASTLTRATIQGSTKYKNVWLFTGPKIWMNNPYFVSMYSYIIRLADRYESLKDINNIKDLLSRFKKLADNGGGDHDIQYLKVCHDKMHIAFTKKARIFGKGDIAEVFKKPICIDTFHNAYGIRSLCAGSTDKDINTKFSKILQEMKS